MDCPRLDNIYVYPVEGNQKVFMKELFWAFYFALHFAGAFLGIVIAINLSTWLGLSMFAFFIVKFMLMMPEIKRSI